MTIVTSADLLSKFENPIVVPPVEQYHNVNFIIFFTRSFHVFVQAFWNNGKSFDLINQVDNWNILFSKYNKNFLSYCAWIVLGAVVLTLVRALINRIVLYILFKFKLLKTVNAACFGESFYSLLFYSIAFPLGYFIEQNIQLLASPERLWANFDLANSISSPLKILLFLEASHYVHSLYAVFYINPWNSKDSALMAFHHVIALALNGLATLNKTIPLGVPLIYLFDACDVLMEAIKCAGKLELNPTLAKNFKSISFGLLLVVWFTFRLYYFPLRVIYPLVLYLTNNPVDSWIPFVFSIFTMFWALFAMNAYWTVLLIKILFKSLRGGHNEIEDIRELDENENVIQLNGDKMKDD